MAAATHDPDFPCSLTVHIPFPSNRLATAALRTLSVDPELSSLVQRSFSLVASASDAVDSSDATVLKTEYKATTNRMLRVAVNGFFESLGTIIQVMEELDIDVIHEKGLAGLEGAQGVEQGLTGSTG